MAIRRADDRSSVTSFDLAADTPVVVLKFDPNVMHHGGLGAIRSLGRLGIAVYGVHEDPRAPAAASRYLHGRFFWRPSAEDVEAVVEGLLQLASQVGRPSVLLTTDDSGSIFLAEHGEVLRSSFMFPTVTPSLPRQLAGKFSLYQLCRQLKVPCPETMIPTSATQARSFAARVGYPIIAKLTTPWRHGGVKLRSTVLLGEEDALERFRGTCESAGAGFMLQEYIPRRVDNDWFVHGYCGGDGSCRPVFTGMKERSYPAHTGLTSLGRAVDNPELAREAMRLIEMVDYRGIFDLDLRFDPRDGQYKLLDFNPRLGAQFRLFQDTAGVDVVRAQYLDLTGTVIPEGTQVSGRRFLVENYDPLCALTYWRQGELDLGVWLSSLRAVDEMAWFASDDLRPFGRMCMRMGLRLATRPLPRRGGLGPSSGGRSEGTGGWTSTPVFRSGTTGRIGYAQVAGRGRTRQGAHV